jgi:plastocyanin
MEFALLLHPEGDRPLSDFAPATRRRIAWAVVALAGLGALGACSDDDSAGLSPDAQAEVDDADLRVMAGDMAFDRDAYEVTAGRVSVAYVQDDGVPHTLTLEGADGLDLEVSGSGDTDTGEVDLPAGEYVLYCDVSGHRQAGMEASLVVR